MSAHEQAVRSRLPALMLVVDIDAVAGGAQFERDQRGRSPLTTILTAVIEGGVNMLQVRDRSGAVLPALAEAAARAIDLTGGRALLWVNANAGLALQHAGAGLHLPEAAAMPPPEARPLLAAISRAVHSAEGAARAEAEGADMLVLGTVFPSASHPGGVAMGLAGVRAACARVGVPVVGIGGITAGNAGDVIGAGASGVAVIRAIFDADDPRAAAAALRLAIDAAWAERRTGGPTREALAANDP